MEHFCIDELVGLVGRNIAAVELDKSIDLQELGNKVLVQGQQGLLCSIVVVEGR